MPDAPSTMLDLPPNDVLREALCGGKVQHPDGRYLDVVANISAGNSRALFQFVRRRRPQLVLEIGMAYGVSTLSILSALEENGEGRLISVDPYLGWPTGRLVALHQIQRAGLAHRHEHRHAPSHEALPQLLLSAARPDFVYIDGCHNVEYVFLDFFYSDKLVSPGGVVAFNDAGWRSVFKVIQFLRRHRKYRELDVGLPKAYHARNPLLSLVKRAQGRSTRDRYFEKQEAWEPGHGFFREF